MTVIGSTPYPIAFDTGRAHLTLTAHFLIAISTAMWQATIRTEKALAIFALRYRYTVFAVLSFACGAEVVARNHIFR